MSAKFDFEKQIIYSNGWYIERIFLSYYFLGGKGNLQDSGKPRNSAKNVGDQTFRYRGVLLYLVATSAYYDYQILNSQFAFSS